MCGGAPYYSLNVKEVENSVWIGDERERYLKCKDESMGVGVAGVCERQ